jgi:WD40 repeat protein
VEADDHFHIYNIHTGGYLCMLQEPIHQYGYHLSFRADGKKLAYISPRENVIIWDLETGKADQIITLEQIRSQNIPANSLLSFRTTAITEPSPVISNWDLIAWGWKNAKGVVESWIINTCDAATSIPSDCPGAISPDRKFTISKTMEDLVVQDTNTQKTLHAFVERRRGSTNFTFSPDGHYILALNYLDWTITVWDSKTYQEIAKINSGMEGEGPILGNQEFSFSSDGAKLATYLPYLHKDAIRVWNTQTWKAEKSFTTKGGIGDIAISGDGKLVVGLSGYVIYIWRLED